MALNRSGSILYVACLNDHIYEFDSSSLLLTRSYTADDFDNSSFFIKIDVSPCGRYIASGSKGSDVLIWDRLGPNDLPLRLQGHRAETSGVAWSHHNQMLASCSDDITVRLWSQSSQEEYSPLKGHAIESVKSLSNSIDLEAEESQIDVTEAKIELIEDLQMPSSSRSIPAIPEIISNGVGKENRGTQEEAVSEENAKRKRVKVASKKKDSSILNFFQPLQQNDEGL